MHIFHVVGARPNFMKAAPVIRALSDCPAVHQTLVHTGQHYDVEMSDVFFTDLGMPRPDINLEVGSGSHAQQTAAVMSRLEPLILERKPDAVLVYGDVNSTVAAALTCAKLLVSIGHVEAGLRSFDRTMPEEINRLLTDQLADWLFTPSPDGSENLLREGIDAKKIHFVGNVMIDTLVRLLPKAQEHRVGGLPHDYALVTLHRPSNVDDPDTLRAILAALVDLSTELAIVFPVHPRTRERISGLGLRAGLEGAIRLIGPLSYLEFLALQRKARVVITDSGGIQEETTYLGIPCLTIRENTERPITITLGTNTVVGKDTKKLRAEVKQVLSGGGKPGCMPPLWDGQAAARIASILVP